jgi:integrase
MKITQQFRVVRRPKEVVSRYAIIVVHNNGLPYQPLTTFYHELQQYVADGTARTYLNTLIPYFSYLAKDVWRLHRQDSWESSPEAIRESVRDYLVEGLHCKAQPKDTYQLVQLTAKSPSTVRVFLSALKQFYHIACRLEWYPYPHPLLDSVAHLMQEVEAEDRQAAGQRPRMPQRSGVEDPDPKQRYTSDNYFKLVEDKWQPQPIDDPNLHMLFRNGFKQICLPLRDQIVIRLAYESGARIREILGLTVGDWRKRNGKQEAWAFSKGSYGRRVKVIRFGKETSRMLHAYVNTERCRFDQAQRRLNALDDAQPLFLSSRGNPYGYDTFKKHWYKLCNVLNIDLNIHALRHWYVTQEIRLICERAKEPGDIARGKEDLVRYMAWRSPDTLQAYEHYFDDIRHAETQDQLYSKWYENDLRYEQTCVEASPETNSAPSSSSALAKDQDTEVIKSENGWGTLLMLGGPAHA